MKRMKIVLTFGLICLSLFRAYDGWPIFPYVTIVWAGFFYVNARLMYEEEKRKNG